jgi:5-methylcytosine-specific restriction protein A
MNGAKLADSIEAFKQYYLLDRDFYDGDERGQKVELCRQFQKVFAYDNITSKSFLDSLRALFEDPQASWTVKWLCGGAYYQYQRFLDLLQSEPSQALLSRIFRDLLFSQESVGDRISRFKKEIDTLYSALPRSDRIQLSLMSQFLGLCFPDKYYIYKYSEFTDAVAYFEYDVELSDVSAGGKYEYYLEFCRKIKAAMNEAGLCDVDFIDVQTFVYRSDWYTPTDLERKKDEFEQRTTELESQSVEKLVGNVMKSKPKPARVVHGVYYYRDPNIAALVKKDARGVCDLCGRDAPFKNHEGKPYLENHHVLYLADGGEDYVGNCVALCPNCHAKMHVLNSESDGKRLLAIARGRHERLFLS